MIVTEEMIEAASKASWDRWHDLHDWQGKGWQAWPPTLLVQETEWRDHIEAGLRAAFEAKP